MIRVAAYCRVATDKSDRANSFESQQRYFREYIEGHPDWALVLRYSNTGGCSGVQRRQTGSG